MKRNLWKMKKWVSSISFLFALIFSCNGQNPTVKQTASEIEMPERGFCAHRGAMKTHPENTIPSFKAAIDAGAQMLELDVWLSKDGQMVVIHDDTVDRTTDSSGKVSELTLAEIKKMDAGSWKSPEFKGIQIPTLEEVLKIIPRNMWLNIHIKEENEVPLLVADLLKKENRLHQAFLACSALSATKVKEIVPDIITCNMDRQANTVDYVQNTIEAGSDFIQLRGDITPELEQHVKRLKERNIKINYFGTDSPEELKLTFQYGIDFPLVNDIVHTIKLGNGFNIVPILPVF